eukprot:5463071-Pleurochrysis_carterae.AAC.1
MWHHLVLLGARRLPLSLRISRAVRTALVFELSARRVIALGAHELDFIVASEALLVSTWRSASRGGQRKAPG